MLGRVIVAERHGLGSSLDLDDDALLDRLASNLASRKGSGLGLNGILNGGELFGGDVDGEQDDLRVDAVLGLGKKVRGNKGRVRSRVGNDLKDKKEHDGD